MGTEPKLIKLALTLNIQPRQTLYGCVLKDHGVGKDSVEDASFGRMDNKVYVFEEGEEEPTVLGSPHQECVILQADPIIEGQARRYAYENVARILLVRNNALVDIKKLSELASVLGEMDDDELEELLEEEGNGFVALFVKAIKELVDNFSEKFNYTSEDSIEWQIEAAVVLNSCIDLSEWDKFHQIFRRQILELLYGGAFILAGHIKVKILELDVYTMGETLEAYCEEYIPELNTELYWGLCLVDYYNTVFYSATHPGTHLDILEKVLSDEYLDHYHIGRNEVSYTKLMELTRGYIRRELGAVISSNLLMQAAVTNKKIVIKHTICEIAPLMQKAALSMMSAVFRNHLPEFWQTSEDISKLYVYSNGLDTPDFIKALQSVYGKVQSITDEFAAIKGALLLNIAGTCELKRYHAYLGIEDKEVISFRNFNTKFGNQNDGVISDDIEHEIGDDDFDFEVSEEERLWSSEDDGTGGLSYEEFFGNETDEVKNKEGDNSDD